MDFKLTQAALAEIETACLVIGVFDGELDTPGASDIDQASDGLLGRYRDAGDLSSALGKTTMLLSVPGIKAQRVLAVGCGKRDKFDRYRFERMLVAAGKYLLKSRLDEACFALNLLEVEDLDADWRLRHAASVIGRSNYLYTETKKPGKKAPLPLGTLQFCGEASQQDRLDEAASIAAGYRRARLLGDLPANICNPQFLVEQAEAIAETHDNCSLEVLDQDAMEKLGMGALLAVARGSRNAPHLIILKYQGAAESSQPVVLVGKGITFDTGGISLKPGDNMDQMKYDMCGAAAVIGAFESIAGMGARVNLISIVAAVENMPDGNAYRPGDVVTSMSGQTVEVLNTDAEGRLILCDALTYAARFKPSALIDVATLTGACVIALGHHASGLMSHTDDLATDLASAGQQAVDRAWRMPLWEEYQEQLDSPFADMKNIGGMPAGSITAGCFLSRFAKDQRWAHLDVAGSAWKWGAKDGASGRPVGLLSHYIMSQAED